VTGVAPAIKEFNGVLVTNMNSIDVECMADDLPERITVDVSELANIGDSIFVQDIDLGEDVTMLSTADDAIVTITTTVQELVEEEVEGEEGELEELEEELEEPEVIEKGKKEEEGEEE
jgi:large subunit ribosomal protein L25